jgi:hypothetical protein
MTAMLRPAPLKLRREPRHAVLAYHELFPYPQDYRYALTCQRFEDHLRLLTQLAEQRSSTKPPLVISFDDGHISNYVQALPLLEKHSAKAIFFVIAGRIGERKDFMNWTHLRELVSCGHRVESHGWSHRILTGCPDSDLRDELIRSRETLEGRLAIPVRALSAPHGRWNGRVLKACADAGYGRLYSSDPWYISHDERPVEVIGRLVMTQSLDAARLLNWLTLGPLEAGFRRVGSVLKRSARYGLGTKLYYRVWAQFSGWNGSGDTM